MVRRDRARGGIALSAICVVLFLTFLDNTIVSVALADIQSSLHAGVTSLQWIVDGYMLAFAGLMLAGGTLGDIFGRRRVLLAGVAVFCGGAVISACAQSSGMLITGRVVMGVGAAACEPGTLSLIRHIYPGSRARARALGIWTAVSGVSLAAGPVLGGLLVETWGWRAVFWFNFAFGVAAFVAAAITLSESSDPAARRLDLPGLVAGVIAVLGVTFAIIEGESHGYSAPWVVALFVSAAAAAFVFGRLEHRSSDPMLDLSVIRRAVVAVPLAVGFITSFGLFAVFFFVALYLQVIVGKSGSQIAIEFLAMSAAMVGAGVLAGRWAAGRGPAAPMAIGCVVAACGIFLIDALIGPSVSTLALAGALALVGFGLGLALVALTASVLGTVSPGRSGMAASAVNTSRELGGVLAVAILGAVVNGHLVAQLQDRLGALGVPGPFRKAVIDAVTAGQFSLGSASSNPLALGNLGVFAKVVEAAEAAFGDGLHIALLIAGALLLLAAVLSVTSLRTRSGE